jgi:hypothetical protein
MSGGTQGVFLTDRSAQWLRDTGNQFAHLHKLLPLDPELQALVKAVINTESRYIAGYPYCGTSTTLESTDLVGAFQPPKESGLRSTVNVSWCHSPLTLGPWCQSDSQSVRPKPNALIPVPSTMMSSLSASLSSIPCPLFSRYPAHTIRIRKIPHSSTQTVSLLEISLKPGVSAMDQIITVLDQQSQSSFDDDYNFQSYFNWTGTEGSLSPPVPNGGNGEPKKANGLVACTHRPSDDLCVFSELKCNLADGRLHYRG